MKSVQVLLLIAVSTFLNANVISIKDVKIKFHYELNLKNGISILFALQINVS